MVYNTSYHYKSLFIVTRPKSYFSLFFQMHSTFQYSSKNSTRNAFARATLIYNLKVKANTDGHSSAINKHKHNLIKFREEHQTTQGYELGSSDVRSRIATELNRTV